MKLLSNIIRIGICTAWSLACVVYIYSMTVKESYFCYWQNEPLINALLSHNIDETSRMSLQQKIDRRTAACHRSIRIKFFLTSGAFIFGNMAIILLPNVIKLTQRAMNKNNVI